MNSKRSLHVSALVLFMTIAVVACDSDEAELTTTSVLVSNDEEPNEATTTSVAVERETTTSVVRGQSVDSYEVVARESDDSGETLYIVIPPGAYTDVDLENFIFDLYESETATHGAEVFDDAAAVDAYLKPESDRTQQEQELVDEHHFVSLVDGAIIRFQGPFSESGEYPIGS